MPWTTQTTSGIKSFSFLREHPLKDLVKAVLGRALVAAAAIGLLAVGVVDVRVACDRMPGDVMSSCKVTNGFLGGLYPVTRYAVGVTSGHAVVHRARKGGESVTLQLDTANGPMNVLFADIAADPDAKRAMDTAMSAYFTGHETQFDHSMRITASFPLFLMPFVMLGLLVVALLAQVLGKLLAPPVLEVDPSRRILRVRPGSFGILREIAFPEISSLTVAVDERALAMVPTAKRAQLVSTLPRNLQIFRRGKPLLILRNVWGWPEVAVVALRDELARDIGMEMPAKPEAALEGSEGFRGRVRLE